MYIAGCADGSDEQIFQVGKMVGCYGNYNIRNFREGCSVGWRVATATDYFSNGGTTVVPNEARWVDVTWTSNGYETSLENCQGYYDSRNNASWNSVTSSSDCTWVSINEQCTLSFINKDYGKSYG